MKFYIYKLTFQSGATYIGQHTEKKPNDGYVTSSKYYERNLSTDPLIKREILLEVKDKETLDIMETLCIRADKCDNYKNVNGTFGNWHFRYTFKGRHHSKEVRDKIGKSSKEKWKDPEYRNNLIAKHIGRKNTEETKQLMSVSASKSWTEERRKQASESGNYSHPHTEETKKQIGKIIKGRTKINNGVEEKMVRNPEKYLTEGWILGKLPVSDEARKRMSESAKKRPCNTAGKIKIHKGDVGKFVSEDELEMYLSQGWFKGVSPRQAAKLKVIGFKREQVSH